MGKEVLVRCVVQPKHIVYSDIKVGAVYPAYLSDVGGRGKDGYLVVYPDELWIHADDVGDVVVGQLSDGFEIVE